MRFQKAFQKLLQDLTLQVRQHYGDNLVSLVVFGSVARGTPGMESDVDLLIICRHFPQGRRRRVETFLPIEDRLAPVLEKLKQQGIHTYLSPIFKTVDEARRGSILFLDMTQDAVILYDQDGFFATLMERWRKRLTKLGAKRIWSDTGWYWDLKPDYRWGEVVEL